MNNAIKITFLASLFLATSCAEETKSDEPSKEAKEETAVKENVTHEDIQDELHLHGDAKWEVSEHMVEHIAAVDSLISNYNVNSGKTPKALAEEVDEKLTMLTQTCNMTGEAHAQLHLWLLPFWNVVDQLSISTDPEQQMNLIKEMNESLVIYHSFFE